MTKNKLITTLLISSAALILQACSSNSTTEANVTEAKIDPVKSAAVKDIKSYVKPGAAVSFGSNYDGETGIGETEDIQITINEQYGSGTLTVNVSTDDGLSLVSGVTQFDFSMDSDDDMVIDLSVNAQTAGKYYINLQALADTGNGQVMPRTQSIAVYVGNKADYKKPKNTLKIEETGDGKVIVMDAQETIK